MWSSNVSEAIKTILDFLNGPKKLVLVRMYAF